MWSGKVQLHKVADPERGSVPAAGAARGHTVRDEHERKWNGARERGPEEGGEDAVWHFYWHLNRSRMFYFLIKYNSHCNKYNCWYENDNINEDPDLSFPI